MYRPIEETKDEAEELRQRGGPEPFKKDEYMAFKS